MDHSIEIFNKVKPKCVSLAEVALSKEYQSGSVQILNLLKDLDQTLAEAIKSIGPGRNENSIFIPINLADYIMVPITNVLKNEEISDTELEHVFSILHILLKYSWCQPGSLSTGIFTQYLTLIAFLIGGKPGQFSIKTHSDETYLNGIVCLDDLLNGCMNQTSFFTASVLQNTKFIPTLGFLISVLLNISVDSPISNVKTSSLEVLNTLFHLLNDGEILSLFFPGTVSSIAKIIKAKPHSNVVAQAFITLSTIVNLVFSDFSLGVQIKHEFDSLEALKLNVGQQNKDEVSEFQLEDSVVIDIPEVTASKKIHRTKSWLLSTLVQFEKALDMILKIDVIRYDKYSVHDSIFQFNVKVIRNCFLSCRPLLPLLLSSLSAICSVDPAFMPLTVDSLVYISEIDALKKMINDLVGEELRSMQYKIMSPDSHKFEAMLQYLVMLLNILNESGGIENSTLQNLIRKLQENISLAIELKNSKDAKKVINKQAENTIESQMLLISSHYRKDAFEEIDQVKLFEGIFTKKTENYLLQLFSVLQNNLTQLSVLDFSSYSDTSNLSYTVKQSVLSWMISCIIAEVETKRYVDTEDFLQFGDEDDTSGYRETENGVTLFNVTYFTLENSTKILKTCSALPSHSPSVAVSTIMGLRSITKSILILKEDFADELMDVLYPVIECLASSNELIRLEAQLVTTAIADMLYDGSVQELLEENSDYLIDALSFNLVGDTLTPKIPIILSILIKLGTLNIVAELDDIIKTIFTLLDMYHGYSSLCEGFFLVFNEIISKIYEDLADYDFEDLALKSADENVNTFGMWGLKSDEEVEDFIHKKAVGIDEFLGDSDDEDATMPDEPIRKGKILEIDSDDSDDESETKSIPSMIDKSVSGDETDDENKWLSPIEMKLYMTISNIMSYAERLLQCGFLSLQILLLKIINRMVPLLATQKSKFLQIASEIWEIIAQLIDINPDLRILVLCVDVLKQLIKYGNTFFTTRFIDIFRKSTKSKVLKPLISKRVEVLIKTNKLKNVKENRLVNRTSTSTNWDIETFDKICEFFMFSLVQLGRFVPIDIAMAIIQITIHYDDNVDHYGYFDDMVLFLISHQKEH